MIEQESPTWKAVMQWAEEREKEDLLLLRSSRTDRDYDLILKGRLEVLEALQTLPQSATSIYHSKPII